MSKAVYSRTVPLMGTLVTIRVVAHDADPREAARREQTVERAFAWFQRIEECCTRFDPRSELMQLTAQVGVAVPVSAILFEALQFALAVAEETRGAFDPTVGYAMEERGFNREHRSGQIVHSALEPQRGPASYRDVRIDPARKTITLLRPLVLDLEPSRQGTGRRHGRARTDCLPGFRHRRRRRSYLGGCNPDGAPLSVGIRHPRADNELIDSLLVSGRAVHFKDYERRSSRRNWWPPHSRPPRWRPQRTPRRQRDRGRAHRWRLRTPTTAWYSFWKSTGRN